MSASTHLPRLLYIGDVPVEATVAGSTLLYRLLQDYPANRLRIAEGNLSLPQSDKRLPDIKYDGFRVGKRRLLNTRFHSFYSSILHLTSTKRARQFNSLLADFQPEAILTVAHGYSWLTAAYLAKQAKLSLHLIVHDDWVSVQENVLPQAVSKRLKRQFGEVYRQATTRLCVSPYMAEDFEKKYGAKGTVLYPSRAADVPEYLHPPERHKSRENIVCAFAGSINTQGHARSLATLASVLEDIRGELIVYSTLNAEGIKNCGLTGSNVTVRPIMPFKELLVSLREKVDVLVVPMSFETEDAQNMKVCFPSKLTDYTAVGLPLLIWGPSYSSAVRWANENPGVAEVVDQPEAEALKKSIIKLMQDERYRFRLGETALAKGLEFFAHEAAIKKFYQSVICLRLKSRMY
jgi:hypothetical protein